MSGERYRLGVRSPPPLDFQKVCEDVGIKLPWKEEVIFVDNEIVEADRVLWKLYSSSHQLHAQYQFIFKKEVSRRKIAASREENRQDPSVFLLTS